MTLFYMSVTWSHRQQAMKNSSFHTHIGVDGIGKIWHFPAFVIPGFGNSLYYASQPADEQGESSWTYFADV